MYHTAYRRIKQNKKFTLIELLIVIVIIAILVAMLLPSLNKVKESARGITCVNNEKQLGFYMINYTDTYNGYYPPYYIMLGGKHWWNILSNAMSIPVHSKKSLDGNVYQVPKFLGCQSVKPPIYGWGSNNWLTTDLFSYGMNYISVSARKIGEIRRPSVLAAFTDIETRPSGYFIIYKPTSGRQMTGTSYMTDWGVASWHNRGTNVLWLDGHVTGMREVGLWDGGKDTYLEQ